MASIRLHVYFYISHLTFFAQYGRRMTGCYATAMPYLINGTRR